MGILIVFCIAVAANQDENDTYTDQLAFSRKDIDRVELTKSGDDEPSSMDEFPEDLFTDEQRLNGAIIFHIIGAIYFFTLLAVVCNDYFLPSVECICEDLAIPQDLAAATFMAIATTTPELFTNIISTFITESDIGLGTIIGSLMFNTLGVAAVASLAATKPVQLDWWPITRDSILYGSNILLLIAFAWDGQITLGETITMVCLFFLYFVILFQNARMRPKVKWFLEDYLRCCRVSSYDLPSSFIEKNFQEVIVTQQPSQQPKSLYPTMDTEKEPEPMPTESKLVRTLSKSSIDNNPIFMIYTKSESVENLNKVRKSLWRRPVAGPMKTIWWTYTWPIKFILTITVPNPKTYRRAYPLTFLMCIGWIGINAYMIVWMMTVVGYTFKIPDVVMGLTFLAAGGCMPEGISSVIQIRKGEGGIGVSNSLGANSLAILMSLGIPWLIKNILNRNVPGKESIQMNSLSTEYNILILLIAVITLYGVLTLAKYRLKRSVGLSLMSAYSVFITIGVLLEMNVFFPNAITS